MLSTAEIAQNLQNITRQRQKPVFAHQIPSLGCINLGHFLKDKCQCQCRYQSGEKRARAPAATDRSIFSKSWTSIVLVLVLVLVLDL